MQRSSKDTFKKAKAIIHANEVICCYEGDPGVIRAVCRDSKGIVSRVEVQGFPSGPYKAECTCNQNANSFCQHAVAACLYHAKYTIKPVYNAKVKKQDEALIGVYQLSGSINLLRGGK